ncbi:hypothetical protein [Streptomyces sp. URMC 129]|uniref:hypothetical protein n=1 Tax=Streptomyces sp. URMC 129 TaxID=3423407 RepID=UPI003F1DCFCF
MELADALRILARSRHFEGAELDLALSYVGCARSAGPGGAAPAAADPDAAGDEPGAGAPADDALLTRGRTDGWSLLSDAELDAAAVDWDDTARGPGEPGGAPGPHGRRPGARHRRARTPDPRHITPFVLDGDRVPAPAPRYDPVPPPLPADAPAPASATHSVIDPRTAATTLHTLLKRPVRGAEIDVDELVRQLALALPVTRAPRLEQDQTGPPLHLLYDTSLLIGPYAGDVRQLVLLVQGLFAAGGLQVRAFRGSLRGGCGSGPVWTWRPFQIPARPSTVLLISGSFGDNLPQRGRELEEFTAELQRKGHHARVLWLGDPPGLREAGRTTWRVIRT